MYFACGLWRKKHNLHLSVQKGSFGVFLMDVSQQQVMTGVEIKWRDFEIIQKLTGDRNEHTNNDMSNQLGFS